MSRTLDRFGRADTTNGLTALLQVARDRGLLLGPDPTEIVEIFMAVLMKGGIMVRMLAGVLASPDEAQARQRAEAATATLGRPYATTVV